MRWENAAQARCLLRMLMRKSTYKYQNGTPKRQQVGRENSMNKICGELPGGGSLNPLKRTNSSARKAKDFLDNFVNYY